MSEANSGSTFADRLAEPPTKLQWLLLGLIDVVTLVGVATEVLGVVWIVIAPTVIAGAVYLLSKALEKPRTRRPAPR